jgi:hypothetical protein
VRLKIAHLLPTRRPAASADVGPGWPRRRPEVRPRRLSISICAQTAASRPQPGPATTVFAGGVGICVRFGCCLTAESLPVNSCPGQRAGRSIWQR